MRIRETAVSQMTIGILWMVGCLASFIGMAVASRELSSDLSVFQILFFRSVVGLFVILVLAKRVLPELRKFEDVKLNFVRNIIHFAAQYCWTLGVVLLPLAEVFALEFTMPVWVALFAFLILGERVGIARILAIIGSFAGVMVIIQPGVAAIDTASLVVILAAMGYGLSVVLVKRLTQHNSPGVIVTWMIVMQLPMGLVLALLDWRMPTIEHVPWILVAGMTGLSAHYTMAQALKNLDASIAIPIDFFRVPLIAVVGFYYYGETLDVSLLVGASLIFFSNFYALRKETALKRAQVHT